MTTGRTIPPGETPVVRWNQTALAAVRATGVGPPVAARALAVLHTCIYEAWAAYDPVAVGTVLGDRLRQPAEKRCTENKAEAISYAAYAALTDLFPTEAPAFAGLMRSFGYHPDLAHTDSREPRGLGTLAARAVLASRHGDGSNQLGDLHPGPYADYTGYRPRNSPDRVDDPNRWQPLRVPDGRGGALVQVCLTPHWGLVRPFALKWGGEFRPAGPRRLPRDGEEFRAQCLEILGYSAGLTDTQKVIAEYWADGPGSETPPGHWCLFAHFVSRRDGHSLDDDVKLFFILCSALLDASICCWDAKVAYDSVRPITAIRHLFRRQRVRAWRGPGLGVGEIAGEDWHPYQLPTAPTPPFPEFPSGHSTFSAAAAEVLKRFTGSDRFGGRYTWKAGTSRIDPGVPRADVTFAWASFSEAADQAGLSRRYGGIHFAEADLVGRTLGRLVGDRVWQVAQGYIQGRPV